MDLEIFDAYVIRKLLKDAIEYANIAVGGAIAERRDAFLYGNVRGHMEDVLIRFDEEAKSKFGDAYKP